MTCDYEFKYWLKHLKIDGEHLTESEIDDIWFFANNGKLELQDDAKEFLLRDEGDYK